MSIPEKSLKLFFDYLKFVNPSWNLMWFENCIIDNFKEQADNDKFTTGDQNVIIMENIFFHPEEVGFI